MLYVLSGIVSPIFVTLVILLSMCYNHGVLLATWPAWLMVFNKEIELCMYVGMCEGVQVISFIGFSYYTVIVYYVLM